MNLRETPRTSKRVGPPQIYHALALVRLGAYPGAVVAGGCTPAYRGDSLMRLPRHEGHCRDFSLAPYGTDRNQDDAGSLCRPGR